MYITNNCVWLCARTRGRAQRVQNHSLPGSFWFPACGSQSIKNLLKSMVCAVTASPHGGGGFSVDAGRRADGACDVSLPLVLNLRAAFGCAHGVFLRARQTNRPACLPHAAFVVWVCGGESRTTRYIFNFTPQLQNTGETLATVVLNTHTNTYTRSSHSRAYSERRTLAHVFAHACTQSPSNTRAHARKQNANTHTHTHETRALVRSHGVHTGGAHLCSTRRIPSPDIRLWYVPSMCSCVCVRVVCVYVCVHIAVTPYTPFGACGR